jgi:hypothetical protein
MTLSVPRTPAVCDETTHREAPWASDKPAQCTLGIIKSFGSSTNHLMTIEIILMFNSAYALNESVPLAIKRDYPNERM